MVRLVRTRLDGALELSVAGVAFISVLAWAAGAVNALGYLAIGDVFTSHMSGNASSSILMLVTGRYTDAARRAAVVLAFFAGATGGALLVEGHREHNAAAALWFEAVLLAGAAFARVRFWELLALAGAMGVQNIALAGSALSAHTTHITGPLTDFAGAAVRRAVGRRTLSRDRSHGMWVYGGRVLAFVAGVATGAALFTAVGAGGLLLPSATVALSGAVLWCDVPAAPRSTRRSQTSTAEHREFAEQFNNAHRRGR
jgi:uncharacterized membrane protein YoaK (UPF0700 family)